ncbi:MAG: hypothetical protein ACOX68_07620 [Candidatus Limivicinus sp.]|jgi:hypothetical protein
MDFDYKSYRGLIDMLREGGYVIADYHSYEKYPRCVILRHDIDTSIEKAVEMAELEASLGVSSTYFVLLSSELYNTASKRSKEGLKRIAGLGHELGLHYDETVYGDIPAAEVISSIKKEADILSSLLDREITTVSMHRPSKKTLESNLQIPGMINSYGDVFFRGFKYLSDSRCRWREPVEEIIKSGTYSRLHILTHAFWYGEDSKSIGESLGGFIGCAEQDRYRILSENITRIDEALKGEQL